MGLNNKNTDDVRKRLRMFRESLGLSQNEIAKIAGIRQASYSQLETGKTKSLSRQVLRLFELELNMNINWLFTGEGDMKSQDIVELCFDLDNITARESKKRDTKMITIPDSEYRQMKEQISQLIKTNMNLSELLNKKSAAEGA